MPILPHSQPNRRGRYVFTVLMFTRAKLDRLSRTFQIGCVDHASSPMIILRKHFSFVHWKMRRGSVTTRPEGMNAPFCASNSAPDRKRCAAAPEWNIVRANTPGVFSQDSIHQHRRSSIQLVRQLGVPAGAEYRAGAGVGVDQRQVVSRGGSGAPGRPGPRRRARRKLILAGVP